MDSKARGYMMMPQVEETLVGYLSPGGASSLKKPTLPTKLCRATSILVGKALQAAGQAGSALHTMADLLKDLSAGRQRGTKKLSTSFFLTVQLFTAQLSGLSANQPQPGPAPLRREAQSVASSLVKTGEQLIALNSQTGS